VAGANANILSWLRGDATQEMRNGGAYRNRNTTVLGDIVDSGPTFAWHEDFGYAVLPEGMGATPNYLSFISTKASAAGSIYSGKGMVYVGADDGMLHGFDATTGKEVFGYVAAQRDPEPAGSGRPGLRAPVLRRPDGVRGRRLRGRRPDQLQLEDGCWSGPPAPGGQGVFALDVTSPPSMESTGSAASNVLWDLDGKGTNNPNGDPDLGFPIGTPIIARLNNGDWSAIFGNGYLSSRGCAVLFIVRLSDGLVQKIDASGLSQGVDLHREQHQRRQRPGPRYAFRCERGFDDRFCVRGGDLHRQPLEIRPEQRKFRKLDRRVRRPTAVHRVAGRRHLRAGGDIDGCEHLPADYQRAGARSCVAGADRHDGVFRHRSDVRGRRRGHDIDPRASTGSWTRAVRRRFRADKARWFSRRSRTSARRAP